MSEWTTPKFCSICENPESTCICDWDGMVKATSQALPPEPGNLEEEAEAYARREFHGRGRAITPIEIAAAFIAGARSRDARIAELEKESWALAYSRDHHENESKRLSALLASQGEELKEARKTEDGLKHAVAEAQKLGFGPEIAFAVYQTKMKYRPQIDSLRAALEQVKAERDELLKGEKSELWLKDLADRDAALARIASLEEGIRKIMKHTLAGVIRVERGQPNGLDATVLDNIARALLAAGDCNNRLNQGEKEPEVKAGAAGKKAGGENA